jgi:hypothetical protein
MFLFDHGSAALPPTLGSRSSDPRAAPVHVPFLLNVRPPTPLTPCHDVARAEFARVFWIRKRLMRRSPCSDRHRIEWSNLHDPSCGGKADKRGSAVRADLWYRTIARKSNPAVDRTECCATRSANALLQSTFFLKRNTLAARMARPMRSSMTASSQRVPSPTPFKMIERMMMR